MREEITYITDDAMSVRHHLRFLAGHKKGREWMEEKARKKKGEGEEITHPGCKQRVD